MENNEQNTLQSQEEKQNRASVKQFIGVIAAVIIIVAVMMLVQLGKSDKAEVSQQTPEPTQTQAAEEQAAESAQDTEENTEETKQENNDAVQATDNQKVSPTFIYFITNADKENADALTAKLKQQYPNVIFDVRNVDENPEELENFPIAEGNTPFLIMLNADNDPCAFETVTDEARAKEIIEAANN